MFTITIMESKLPSVLELFFETPKHWHFEELLDSVRLGRPQLARWLKVLLKDGIIKRVKPKGKMPYYIHNFEDTRFRLRKKMFARQQMFESGLMEHLASL